jgi:hypothetical protein
MKRPIILGCGLLVLLVAGGSELASARTISAISGVQSTATSPGAYCFRFHSSSGDVGIQKVSDSAGGCDPAFFIMPIVWDTDSPQGTSRTIRVVGKRGSSSSFLTCQAINYGSDGNIVSQSAALSITTNLTYSGIDLVLNHVPAQSFGVVVCNMSPLTPIIQGIDYLQ